MAKVNHCTSVWMVVFSFFIIFGNLNATNTTTKKPTITTPKPLAPTTTTTTISTDPVTPCGDWDKYSDEKCIKVIDEMHTYNDALAACKRIEPTSTLISIHSAEEQNFMQNTIYSSHRVVDTVWLDAQFVVTEKKFRWTDGVDLTYTNWVNGSPTTDPTRQCVQMTPDSKPNAKWQDEPCNKRNLVVCERLQTWTPNLFQRNFLNSRKALRDELQNAKDQLTITKNELTITKNQLTQTVESVRVNSVPVGFLYVQLPGEAAPLAVFKYGNWTDVSKTYAGVFFRVAGGGADAFGKVQAENSPHLDTVEYKAHPCDGLTAKITPGTWSPYVLTGILTTGAVHNCNRYLINGGEVRPRNMAIQVWKRTA